MVRVDDVDVYVHKNVMISLFFILVFVLPSFSSPSLSSLDVLLDDHDDHNNTIMDDDDDDFVVDVFVFHSLVSVFVRHLNGSSMLNDPHLTYHWDDGAITHCPDREDIIPSGKHHVQVQWNGDKKKKKKLVHFEMSRSDGDECWELHECAQKRKWENKVMLVECLVHAAHPALWWNVSLPGRNSIPVTRCHVRAGVVLARQISSIESHFHFLDAQFGGDDGALFVATLLAHGIEKRAKQKIIQNIGGGGGGNYDLDLLIRLMSVFARDDEIYAWFTQWRQNQMCEDTFLYRVSCKLWRYCPHHHVQQQHHGSNGTCIIALFGPQGFNNDPIFAPIMAHANDQCRVISVIPRKYMFHSSSVLQVSFPWRLELHVELTSRYWHHVLTSFGPVIASFASDSGAVLAMSWLRGPSHYPLCQLSKLCHHLVVHSPHSVIVSKNDGYRNVWLNAFQANNSNVSVAHHLLTHVSSVWYLKREFSESSNGVCYVDVNQPYYSMEKAIQRCFPRASGIPLMDLKLPTRLFFQLPSLPQPSSLHIGYRFLSHHGRLVSCHGSAVLSTHSLKIGITHAYRYVSIRHAVAERKVRQMIHTSKYHGFGAAWFVVPVWRNHTRHDDDDDDVLFSFSSTRARVLHDEDEGHGAELIDFNPRLERHTCLAFANETHKDPCRSLQQWLMMNDDDHAMVVEPYYYPANVVMVDPTRFLDYDEMIQLSANTNDKWNIEKNDHLLYETFEKAIRQKTN